MSVKFQMRACAGLLAGAALALTAACGANDNNASANAGNAGEIGTQGKPTVTAAFYPLQWLSQQVGGADVTVAGLTKPGVEPHDLELTARQVVDIQQSGLVVYIKGVQPAVDEAVTEHAAGRSFDAASVVKTIAATEEDHAEESGQTEEHSDVGYDPHLWLDPSRLATVATDLGARLAVTDPAHAAGYRDRAAKVAATLSTLDKEYERGLATCDARAIVTSHAAFGYLADRYKLEQVGISGIDPDAEPSPARLAEVADIAKQKKVTTIFTEELVSPKVAEVLAKEVGAKTAVLNPIESEPETGDYLSAARQNLQALRTALGCS